MTPLLTTHERGQSCAQAVLPPTSLWHPQHRGTVTIGGRMVRPNCDDGDCKITGAAGMRSRVLIARRTGIFAAFMRAMPAVPPLPVKFQAPHKFQPPQAARRGLLDHR